MGTVQFVSWTGTAIHSRLKEAGFLPANVPGVMEDVYERDSKTPGIRIRVYTSVAHGGVRDKGKDAARVTLVWMDRIIWKARRVHRTQGFLDNLIERCREAYRMTMAMPCCHACGKPMVLRKSKHGVFWGCVRFPECRATLPAKK